MTRYALLACALAALTSPLAAHAQSKKDFSTVRFYPAVGAGNYIGVEGAVVSNHLHPSYGVWFDFSADTLRVDEPCDGIRNAAANCENRETSFVRSTGLLHLNASVALHKRTQLSFDLPLGFTDTEPFSTRVVTDSAVNPTRVIQPQQGFQLADARLAVKTHIWSTPDDSFRFAATVFSTLPTAMLTSNGDCRDPETCGYLGERGVQAGGYAVGEFARGDFRAAVNVGAAYRPKRKFLTEETGTELLYGAAGMYSITPLLHAKAEVMGFVGVRARDYPLEARGLIALGGDFQVNLGAGAGIIGDVGRPSYRLFAGAQWTPVKRDTDGDGIDDRDDACPADPEDRDGFMDHDGCPEPDNDGDGVPDDKDACPNDAEDMDGFADEDGCPELDNDGDGVPDGYDSCEGEMEDMDGDRDDDGCPDLDADRDGIDDAVDLCPNEPEDSDGLGDDDGCPEVDFDGDTIPDDVDACPEQPESWNGLLDQDGCPEDDEDNDGVPDQVDRCPGQAETLNGKDDGDGCPDGARIVVLQDAQRLVPTATAQFDGNTLRGGAIVADVVADFVKRNHQQGSLHVVVVAPEGDPHAEARAAAYAEVLGRRTGRTVTSAHVVGTPLHVEIELVPPGLKQLPRPKPPAPSEPPAAAPEPTPATP